jgi:hypothetical protein
MDLRIDKVAATNSCWRACLCGRHWRAAHCSVSAPIPLAQPRLKRSDRVEGAISGLVMVLVDLLNVLTAPVIARVVH